MVIDQQGIKRSSVTTTRYIFSFHIFDRERKKKLAADQKLWKRENNDRACNRFSSVDDWIANNN